MRETLLSFALEMRDPIDGSERESERIVGNELGDFNGTCLLLALALAQSLSQSLSPSPPQQQTTSLCCATLPKMSKPSQAQKNVHKAVNALISSPMSPSKLMRLLEQKYFRPDEKAD